MKTVVSAMDFGTSKLVALVAEANGRERCDIIGAGTALYDGYLDGQWNAPSELNNAINNAIHEAEEQAKVRIRDINIGVPGDFCTVRAVEAKVDLQGADPHVTIKDIDELFERATQALGEVRGQIIHRSPAWFMVDDGEKTLEPMNAYERHVIHTALQDVKDVSTFSIGTDPNRRVVVAYDRNKQVPQGEE